MTTAVKNDFGIKLKRLRESYNLTCFQIAVNAGTISPSQIANVENGYRKPSVQVYKALLKSMSKEDVQTLFEGVKI